MAMCLVRRYGVSLVTRGLQFGAHENGMAHRHEILGELHLWFPCAD